MPERDGYTDVRPDEGLGGSATQEGAAALARDKETPDGSASTIGDDPRLDTTASDLSRQLLERQLRARLFGALPEPVRIGRYVLLAQVGSGAMGVVFSAYDETLDRKVAIKFIHAERAQSEQARIRLLREARAMARISHPNVVPVYEAGEERDRVFVAMEFVEGSTLRAWLSERRGELHWREILKMFARVGQGLAAVHAVGIVHRDFKPDNVLVTAEGTPKVADFGLAGIEGGLPTTDRSGAVDEVSITQTGAAIGTPVYMSAEQHAGRRADWRTDQFSFSVALFEALYGARPFGGDTHYVLATNVVKGKMQEVPHNGVPSRVRTTLLRGMATDPDDRWPSMRQLVAQLERQSRRSVTRWLGFASAGLAASAAFAVGARTNRNAPCSNTPTELAEIWNDEVREQVRGAVGEKGRRTDAGLLSSRLDRYAERWLELRTEGCNAHENGMLTESVYLRQQICLDASLQEFSGVTQTVLQSKPMSTAQATTLAKIAPDPRSLSTCADPVRVTERFAPYDRPSNREQFIEARVNLARASALTALGRFDEARGLLDSVEATVDQPDLQARVFLVQGQAARIAGNPQQAAERLNEAVASADDGSDDYLRARALVELAWTLGVELHREEEARRVAIQARGAIARTKASQLHASLESTLGMTALNAGDLAEAVTHLRNAVSLVGDDAGVTERIDLHSNLGVALIRSGALDEAATEYQTALSLVQRRSVDEPVQRAQLLNNLGYLHNELDNFESALNTHRASLRLRERLYGQRSIPAANAHNGIGIALLGLRRNEEALAHLETSIQIRSDKGGPEPDLAEAEFALARALLNDDPLRASKLAEQARQRYGSQSLAKAHAAQTAEIEQWLDEHEDYLSRP